MDTIRKLRSPWVIVTLLLATYAGSYFAVSEYSAWETQLGWGTSRAGLFQGAYRRFNHEWMIDVYRPLTYVESKMRRRRVTACYFDPVSNHCLIP